MVWLIRVFAGLKVKMLVLSCEDSYLNDSLYSEGESEYIIQNDTCFTLSMLKFELYTHSRFFILSACNILDICMYLQVLWKNSVDPGQMASLEAS